MIHKKSLFCRPAWSYILKLIEKQIIGKKKIGKNYWKRFVLDTSSFSSAARVDKSQTWTRKRRWSSGEHPMPIRLYASHSCCICVHCICFTSGMAIHSSRCVRCRLMVLCSLLGELRIGGSEMKNGERRGARRGRGKSASILPTSPRPGLLENGAGAHALVVVVVVVIGVKFLRLVVRSDWTPAVLIILAEASPLLMLL